MLVGQIVPKVNTSADINPDFQKLKKELVGMLMSWRHSGFNVFCGSRIYPRDETAMENLARYIIRASFSQEQMARY
jgi:hypothetical protein